MFEAWGRVLYRRRRLTLIVTLVLVAFAAALGTGVFGKLVTARQHRKGATSFTTVADIAKFASRHPQGADSLGTLPELPFDSDPYAIVPYRGGFAIADAAANAILWLMSDEASYVTSAILDVAGGR